MGLTELGYQRRTYEDILNNKIARAKELFGEDIDTSDLTPLGKFIRINAYDQAVLEEEIESVYYARFPNTASGQSLDRLLIFGGITRNPATPAAYSAQVQGEAGYVIEVGFLVGTDAGLTYYVTQEATIGEDGTCMVEVSCTEAGTIGNVSASAINRVVNPNASVAEVLGKECISAGTDEENDPALRERLKAAVSGQGSCNTNALRSALLRIPTVQFAAVIENESDEADGEGRPAHSFECYVLGGDGYEQEIGEAIFSKRPVGIQTAGTTSVVITDASGNERTVKYSPAPNVSVMVRAKIKTSLSYPDDGASRIQTAVAGYINSLGIGNSLVLSALYGHIYGVAGVTEVVTLELSTDGGSTYSAGNVTIPQYGVAVCSGVVVEVVAQ